MWKPTLVVLLLFGIVGLPAHARTCTATDLKVPTFTEIPDSSVPLVLNGYGTRTKFLWDVYIGALYLPRRSSRVPEILAMPGPKRLWLHFLREVSAEKLLEGWRDGFEGNNTPAQLALLAQRLEKTYPLFRTMKEGESLTLDYLPGVGTQLRIEGKPDITISGEDFYRAILKVWLGERPAQSALRDCLLGGNAAG